MENAESCVQVYVYLKQIFVLTSDTIRVYRLTAFGETPKVAAICRLLAQALVGEPEDFFYLAHGKTLNGMVPIH